MIAKGEDIPPQEPNNGSEQPTPVGGKGEGPGSHFLGEHDTKPHQSLRMAARAAREGWGVSPAMKQAVPAMAHRIIQDEAATDALQLQAGRLLVECDKRNAEDDYRADMLEQASKEPGVVRVVFESAEPVWSRRPRRQVQNEAKGTEHGSSGGNGAEP